MKLSPYSHIFERPNGGYILYSPLTGGLVTADEDFISRFLNDQLTKEEDDTLDEMRITVQDKDQERLEVMGLLDHWNKIRNSFNVVAVMNLNCNFSCVYCYEGDRKNPNLRMSLDTADKLEKFILKNRKDNDNVRIDFYGGEPLLDVPMIRYISEKMATMTQQNGKLYEFYLVTNGSLLTEKVLDTLIPLGLRGIKITLDGPKDIHDKQRPYVHGKGSFAI
jgi:uncharacterized protein